MTRYHFEIDGDFEYDMMPKVYKVILVGKGHIEDYEIPIRYNFSATIKEIEE